VATSTAHSDMTGSVKSVLKSPDIANQSAEDMGGQRIFPLSSKILEGGQTMSKPPVPHPETCLPQTEDHNPEIFNVREVESFSSGPHTYNATELPDNYLLVSHPCLPPIPMMAGLCHYPESLWHPLPEPHIIQKAEIGNILTGPQVSFSPSPYPFSHQLGNIDLLLLPPGPISFLYPNPMFELTVQPDNPFWVRSTFGHPNYYQNGHPSELANMNVDKNSQ